MTRETALKRDLSTDGSGVLFHIVLLILAPVRRERLRQRSERLRQRSEHLRQRSNDPTEPDDLPTDARDLWAGIIDDMTGRGGTDNEAGDEPRRSPSGGSLRPRFSELEPPLSDPSEGDPADFWRLYDNRRTWEGLSEDEDAANALPDEHDHGPSGWTTPV
jgi:hypothetical protein